MSDETKPAEPNLLRVIAGALEVHDAGPGQDDAHELIDFKMFPRGSQARLGALAYTLEQISPEMAREVHQDWCAAAYSPEKECGCGRAAISEILTALSGHHDATRGVEHPGDVRPEPRAE